MASVTTRAQKICDDVARSARADAGCPTLGAVGGGGTGRDPMQVAAMCDR